MQALLSPQFATSGKHDLFSKQRSPSFRNKRVPSVQEHCPASHSHALKASKQDSPSQFSEEIKRRRSEYLNSNQLVHSSSKKKSKTQIKNDKNDTNSQNIINSIQDLKDEYRTLREAYKGLIQEKVQHSQEMQTLKQDNKTLK